MLDIGGGDVQTVCLTLFELQDGKPLPLPGPQINIRPWRRGNDWETLTSVDLILGGKVGHKLGIFFGSDTVGGGRHILFAKEKPNGHHGCQKEAPDKCHR